jgi:two-component system sensor histidine kinase PilS (NtrC family)
MAIRLSGINDFEYKQNLTLLKIYNSYRVILAAVLLLTFSLQTETPLVGGVKPLLFSYTIVIYLIINVLSLVIVLPKKFLLGQPQLFLHFMLDLLAITFIVDSSGGLPSGLGVLYIVIVAASSILLRGQIALLLAAMASIIILADTLRLIHQNYLSEAEFLASGVMGCMLFATTLFLQMLSKRIRKSREQAQQSAADASKLEQLNQLIVQRMRTGIVITDNDGQIKLANNAAGELLGSAGLHPSYQRNELPALHPMLLSKLQEWQKAPQIKFAPFKNNIAGRELQISFTRLLSAGQSETLVFLEDNRQLAQRAQQIKLASLGRLTASIAHEIRNPLSAIHHAAQLLSESASLDKADQRLSDIIQNHAKRMDQIVENVLQLSRRKSAEPEQIELTNWLNKVIEDFKNSGHHHADIQIITEDKIPAVTIDPSQLNQVLTNLMENGLRYSQQLTGVEKLSLALGLSTNNRLPYLDIIDYGPGIPEQAIENLFEPFYTTEANGTGLGLFISKELCEANEARLNYLRTEQGQSCFRISFPHPDRRIEQADS